jgi:salicylate hydroxylase
LRQTRTIVVAGGGIGGLTAALAIAAARFRVVVLERSERLSEAGAGIQLSPNAGRILAGFGMEAEVASAAIEIRALEVRSGHPGRRITNMPLGKRSREKYGHPYRVIHRADLQAILAAKVRAHGEIDLRLGTELVEFGVHTNGITVLAESRGTSADIRASALIAADGVRSAVRARMPGGAPVAHTGRTAWRTVIKADDAPIGLSRDSIGLWIGPDAHFVHYPIRGRGEINVVAIVREDWDGPGWSEPGDPEWITRRFRRWAPVVRAAVKAAPHWAKWPLLTVAPSGAWVDGPVALLGDAAHAMLPFLAQGGAMAIEDAAVLGRAFAAQADDPIAALAAYEKGRRARVRRIWRAAKAAGELYHLGAVTGTIRDAGMEILGGRMLLSRYDWIYGWKLAPPKSAAAAPAEPARRRSRFA